MAPNAPLAPVPGLPPGAPQPMPGETKAQYEARLNKWLNDFVHGKVGNFLPNPVAPITGAAHDVASGIGVLTNPNTWIRVAEFVVGGILIAVGLSKMTGTSGTVKKVAKAAVL